MKCGGGIGLLAFFAVLFGTMWLVSVAPGLEEHPKLSKDLSEAVGEDIRGLGFNYIKVTSRSHKSFAVYGYEDFSTLWPFGGTKMIVRDGGLDIPLKTHLSVGTDEIIAFVPGSRHHHYADTLNDLIFILELAIENEIARRGVDASWQVGKTDEPADVN